MKIYDYFTFILPRTLQYAIARQGLVNPILPFTLTFSVTNRCQSRCKTCNIWKIYPDHIQDMKTELSLEEIEKIFKSMGNIYFFNLSGGEPFLRKDLPEIVELAIDHLSPRIIHSPTNALAPDRTINGTRRILEIIAQKSPGTPLTIKPSIDGVGDLHDEIRGVKGNWPKLMETIEGLKQLEKEYPNFHLELGTVVSNFNKDRLEEIEDFVHSMGVQSYRNEIAEQREEFLNIGDPITPTGEEYAELMKSFAAKIRKSMKNKRPLARMTESLRLVYYELAAEIVTKNMQVIPCYGGISNVHLTPHGDLWPCCVLGYAKPLGSLRDADFDFNTVWRNKEAKAVRKHIKNKECACPLANQAYSNIMCHPPSLIKAAKNMLLN